MPGAVTGSSNVVSCTPVAESDELEPRQIATGRCMFCGEAILWAEDSGPDPCHVLVVPQSSWRSDVTAEPQPFQLQCHALCLHKAVHSSIGLRERL